MPKRVDHEERRREIVEAVIRITLKGGLTAATVREVAAEAGVGWVAMHMQGEPRTMQQAPHYDDVVAEVRAFLVDRAAAAVDAGVSEVWVDPGIGFGKTTEHNLSLLKHLNVLVSTGYPVIVGTSRKRFLGALLAEADRPPPAGLVPVDDRIEGSVASAVWAMVQGVQMVRVHDVRATVHAAKVVAG